MQSLETSGPGVAAAVAHTSGGGAAPGGSDAHGTNTHGVASRVTHVDGDAHGTKDKRRGFLPEKRTVPKEFTGEVIQEWRNWVEDVEDYLDGIMPGMQEFLKDFAKKEEPADADWRQH